MKEEMQFFSNNLSDSKIDREWRKFTPREIDIIAGIFGGKTILSGRTAQKTIANLLSKSQKVVSHRTVETHIRNISRKLGGKNQEQIINLIEISGKYLEIRKHYQLLYFEKLLDTFRKRSFLKFYMCMLIMRKINLSLSLHSFWNGRN